jgi:hypothetical protein
LTLAVSKLRRSCRNCNIRIGNAAGVNLLCEITMPHESMLRASAFSHGQDPFRPLRRSRPPNQPAACRTCCRAFENTLYFLLVQKAAPAGKPPRAFSFPSPQSSSPGAKRPGDPSSRENKPQHLRRAPFGACRAGLSRSSWPDGSPGCFAPGDDG